MINHFDDVKTDVSGAPGTGGGSGGTDGPGAGGSNAGGDVQVGGGSNAGGASNAGGGVNAGGAAGMTAGDSGTAGAAGAASDSGLADVPAPKLINCDEVAGTRRKITDFSNATGSERFVSDRFFMTPLVNGNTARLIVQHNGNPGGYTVYYVGDNSFNGPFLVPLNFGRVLEVHKTAQAITTAFAVNSGAQGQQFLMHNFDDNTQQQQPAVVLLTGGGALGTDGQIEGTFAPDSSGNIGIVASYVPTQGTYRAGFALFSGTPVTFNNLFDASTPDEARPSSSFRVNDGNAKSTFAFFGEFGAPKPQSQISMKDGAGTGVARNITSAVAGEQPYVLVESLNSTGKLNLAVVKINGGTGAFSLIVGQVATSEANTFDVDKLTVAKQATSFSEVPFGGAPGFFEDYLMFVGPIGVTRRQLSVWAIDIQGRTRVEQKLWDTTGKVSNTAVAPRGTGIIVGGRYHIAWTETMTDDAGMNGYDALWYAQIGCF